VLGVCRRIRPQHRLCPIATPCQRKKAGKSPARVVAGVTRSPRRSVHHQLPQAGPGAGSRGLSAASCRSGSIPVAGCQRSRYSWLVARRTRSAIARLAEPARQAARASSAERDALFRRASHLTLRRRPAACLRGAAGGHRDHSRAAPDHRALAAAAALAEMLSPGTSARLAIDVTPLWLSCGRANARRAGGCPPCDSTDRTGACSGVAARALRRRRMGRADLTRAICRWQAERC
jgi:hypothetical protein